MKWKSAVLACLIFLAMALSCVATLSACDAEFSVQGIIQRLDQSQLLIQPEGGDPIDPPTPPKLPG